MTNAFGIVAMVAMTPLIVIQIMGFIYNWKVKTTAAAAWDEQEIKPISTEGAGEIIEFEEESSHE